MGLADPLVDATRPTNRIEHVRAPRGSGAHDVSPAPGPGPALETPDPEPPGAPASGDDRSVTSGKRSAGRSKPEAIVRAYFVEDKGEERRYYEDDRRERLAMRATESTISSKREDRRTVGAMLALVRNARDPEQPIQRIPNTCSTGCRTRGPRHREQRFQMMANG